MRFVEGTLHRSLLLSCALAPTLLAASGVANASSSEIAASMATVGGVAEEATTPWYTRPDLRVFTTFSDESPDFQRITSSTLTEFEPGPDTRLRVQPLYTHFREGGASVDRFSLGFEGFQALPAELSGRLRYRLHVPDGITPTHEVVGELSRNVYRSLAVRVGGRLRAIVDSPPPYEEIAYLEGAGSGGGTLAAIRQRTQIGEGYLALSFSPLPHAYVYGEAAYGSIDDGNDAWTAVWGLGVDLLPRVLAEPDGHELRLRYDSFYLAMDEPRATYFSPSGFNVHTPSLEWRWTPSEGTTLGLSSGIALRRNNDPGWNVGAFGRVPLSGPFELEGRVYRSDDTQFEITSAMLALRVLLR